jgi:rhamnosyl/mannosyltransferase
LHIGQAFTPEVVWLASKIKGIKYIAHIHTDAGSSGFAGKLLPLYKKTFLGFVLRHADKVIALNESYRKLLIEKYRVKEDRIAVIPNGADKRFFNDKLKTKQKESFRLLYVGRLTIEKNVSMIIEAVGKTKAPIQLDIVGDGPLLHELKRQTQQVKNQKIIFYGKKTADELVKFYQVADALVLASDYEGQPTVIMEAMASGTPVVGTDVIGIRDTIGSNGILVEKNATALTRAITKLSSDLTLRKALAEKARKRAEEFRWEKSIQELRKVYAEL